MQRETEQDGIKLMTLLFRSGEIMTETEKKNKKNFY